MGRRPKGLKVQLRDGSGSITLNWLSQEWNRHGTPRIYFRRFGKRIQIKGAIGTQEFLSEYYAALNGAPASAKKAQVVYGSLRWLAEAHYKSPEFLQQSERTQYVRKRILDDICVDHGDKPYTLMEPRHVRAIRNASAIKKGKNGDEVSTPEAGNARTKALRQLFKWAIETLDAKNNPARDVPYLNSGSEGFHTWTLEEVQQYWDRHPVGTKARLAIDLLLFTGVRRSDGVRLGRDMERDGGRTIVWTEVKGRKKLLKARELPILPDLRKSIDAAPSEHSTYLVTEYGKPFTSNGFGNWFRKRCNEAGLTHCSAHGLRKAGATIAADNGATEYELMSVFGWESPKEAARYTKKANRKRMAARAIHLISPNKTGT